jgi:peptidase A4-like protein
MKRFLVRGCLHSFRSRALFAAVLALGLVMAASAGTASAAGAPMSNRAAVRIALEHLLVGWHHANHPLGRHASLGTGLNQVVSGNWSGYADDNSAGNTYSSVSGHWTEPAITGCKAHVLSAVVFWVGLDGFRNGTVEQDGTIAICPSGGSTVPIYATWWEMYPSNFIQFIGLNVRPGDKISASVVRTGTSYTLQVTDSTTQGNNFSTTQSCSAATCQNASAEWIAEAPSTSKGEVPLSNFGTWTLTNAAVTAGSSSGTIKNFPDDEITMEGPGGKVMAQPGPLNTPGNQFNDTWNASG